MTDIARIPAPAGFARRELAAGWGWLLFTLGTAISAMVAPIYKKIGTEVASLDIVGLRAW